MSVIGPISTVFKMSVVFDLSIYTATANSCTVGNETCCWDFFEGGGVGEILIRR